MCVTLITIEEVINLNRSGGGHGKRWGTEMVWNLCKYSTHVRNFIKLKKS